MLAASAFLALAILGNTASSSHDTFRYVITSSVRQVRDVCQLCYADDCLDIDPLRCEYFEEMDEITAKDEPDGPGAEVDDMISDLTEQATLSWWSQKCIPVISFYTNCNKENLCLGCKSCQCSEAGDWLCSTEQKCSTDHPLDVNHRTLISAVETLLEKETKTRKKRFVAKSSEKEAEPISMVDIAEWMYGVTPTVTVNNVTAETDFYNDIENAIGIDVTAETTTVRENSTTEKMLYSTDIPKTTMTMSTQTETEYLGFEEVLSNIANEKIINKKESQLRKEDETFDYMEINDITPPEYNNTENFMKLLNDLEDGNRVTSQSTADKKFVIDLYPVKNTSYQDTGTDTADVLNSLFNNTIEENNSVNLAHEEIEIDPINIMKRDVSHVENVTEQSMESKVLPTIMAETTTSSYITNKGNDLNNNVLLPLTNIIDDKENELKELFQIRDNLIRIMNSYDTNVKANITAEHEAANASSAHFSVYKLDLYPEIQGNLRRINLNVTEKLLYKLKRDIYEVFKDIARFQRLSRNETIPNDLKMLIRSMKYYVTKQGGYQELKSNEIVTEHTPSSRRFMTRRVDLESKSIVKQLVDILNVLDRDSLQTHMFSNLSRSSKKIVKRVIKNNYVDDISPVGYRVFDPDYSLTGDLRTIGKTWPTLTANLANSSPHERLYALKLLHFTLCGDMLKMTDAIALVDFAHSRRMSPIETPMAEEVMERINTGLLSIKSKIQTLMKYQSRQDRAQSASNTNNQKKKKKESFFRRIRNMLRGSRDEIIDMSRKKVPKSEIFKTIAKKKLQELARKKLEDDEKTMLKWQRTLHVTKRKRRDLNLHIKRMKSRIKNIIPEYLRGKIDPELSKHKMKWQGSNKKKKGNKRPKSIKTTTKAINQITTLPPISRSMKTLIPTKSGVSS